VSIGVHPWLIQGDVRQNLRLPSFSSVKVCSGPTPDAGAVALPALKKVFRSAAPAFMETVKVFTGTKSVIRPAAEVFRKTI